MVEFEPEEGQQSLAQGFQHFGRLGMVAYLEGAQRTGFRLRSHREAADAAIIQTIHDEGSQWVAAGFHALSVAL